MDDIISPVDATKAILSGTTGIGYKVVVTGGQYAIPPVYADSAGRFEITVALVQESLNTFSIKVEDSGGTSSETIQIVIEEGDEAATEAETSGGGDHTAPGSPAVDSTPETIDADTYTFTGVGEAGGTLTTTTSDSSVIIDGGGDFSITFDLEQDVDNEFRFIVIDSAGNVSPSTKVTITEISTVEGDDDEETTVVEAPTDDDDDNTVEINTGTQVILLTDIYGHWAQDYITDLVTLGVVEGYDDGTFLPNEPVNRAEFLKMVLGALNFEIPESADGMPFSDVDESAWYAPYILVAYENGIVDGYDNGTFAPGNEINRAEALKILLGAAGIESHVDMSIFPDVMIDDWFNPYVMTANSLGIVSGYSDGTFGPGESMTRAEVCKVLMGLLDQL